MTRWHQAHPPHLLRGVESRPEQFLEGHLGDADGFHIFPGGRNPLHSPVYYATTESPLGPLLLAWKESGLTRVNFLEGGKAIGPDPGWTAVQEPPFGAGAQLASYFAGDLKHFDLPLAPCGTAFQQAVWRELTRIPFAGTASYGEIARRVGRPKASRAVGAANGNNPLPIIVPCHRVVGSDGSLTGYSGGVEIKEFLLAHEARCAVR